MRRRHPFAWAWMAMAAAVLAGCTTASPDGQSSSAPQGPPIHFSCSDGSKLTARYSQPDTRTLWLRRADGVAELKSQPAASGSRYEGSDVSFWEHQGEVQLRWGPYAAPLRCVRATG
jgi:membrane-bound inhibitor of C-type lysozyme